MKKFLVQQSKFNKLGGIVTFVLDMIIDRFSLFQEAFLRESEKKRDKQGRVSKLLQLRPNAMPTIFPWNTSVQSQKTAGKTVDQVDQEHSEANDLETELRRDAMSVAGSSLHPGNSRFVSDGPIPGKILQLFF